MKMRDVKDKNFFQLIRKSKMYKQNILLFLLLFNFNGCENSVEITEPLLEESLSSFEWNLPATVRPPRVPKDNPMSNEKVTLGRFLFYDTNLSFNHIQSCSSCHLQENAFADHKRVGEGTTGEFHTRNPQHLINAGYYTSYTWGNPALGILEKQIILPLTGDNPIELGISTPELEKEVLSRFENNETYRILFSKIFEEEKPVTLSNVIKALSAFVRTLNSFNSPYDRYIRGEGNELNTSATRGMNLFNSERAECFHCHDGINFSDSYADTSSFFIVQDFHNLGLYNIMRDGTEGNYPPNNQGVFEITNLDKDKGRFRTPNLRNVALTAPYMHDGSLTTLEDVLDHHSRGGTLHTEAGKEGDGRNNPYKSDLIIPKNFTSQEKRDIINFLHALTDKEFINNPKFSSPFKEIK